MPNEAQEYLTGARTTPLTNHSLRPKFYPKRSLKKRLQAGGGEVSTEQHRGAAGITGPHRGRMYKITPSSSPTPPDLPNEQLSSDIISKHMGTFMAEVEPTAGKDGRISLGRMVSIRLHVAEEPLVISNRDRRSRGGEGQEVTAATNFKRWVSTDALSVQRSDHRKDAATTTQSVEGMTPSSTGSTTTTTSRSRGSIPNGFLSKEGKSGNQSNHITSENGSVLNSKETNKGKRHHHQHQAKKRWKIKRIFGIKN